MTTDLEFQEFPSIKRLSREMVITEKIDGTNAQIIIGEAGEFLTASRKQLITPDKDNYGFSTWAHEHKDELMQLGPGRHFGEWWGEGIQRRYGLKGKHFSLFNVERYSKNPPPPCCKIVPVLYRGDFCTETVRDVMRELELKGSVISPGFMNPEGVVIFHTASRTLFKKTFEGDEGGKGRNEARQ